MQHSIQPMPRPIRRRLKRTVQRSKDRNLVRRAMALLHLAAGYNLSETAKLMCAARSTVQRWRGLYLVFLQAVQPFPGNHHAMARVADFRSAG